MLLEPIIESTRRRVALLPPEAELRDRAAEATPARPFGAALTSPGLQVIAEVKRRSPSAGEMAPGLDPAVQAAAYVAGGAAAISVLTEPDYFAGSLDDLRSVRKTVDVPVLRKDFVVDTRQVWEAKAAGADAVLLIVAVLGGEVRSMLDVAAEANIAALVEVHTEAECRIAIEAGATIVGVNNRDLNTFVTDLAVAERLAARLPSGIVRVAESGVSSAKGSARMAASGYDAVLVGEALVRSGDPTGLLRELRGAS